MFSNRLLSSLFVVSIFIATSLFALPAIRAQEYVNPNLIVDGTTEAADMNAWRLYGAAGTFTAEKFVTDPACVAGGDGACQARVIHLKTTGTTGGIQQLNIPVQRGKTYQFFFKYRLLSGNLSTRFGIHSSNGDFANMSEKISKVTPVETYWDYARNVTIPNDFNGDFRLVFVLQNGEAYIDEINLWDVEEVMNPDYMVSNPYSDADFLVRDPVMDMSGTMHWQPWGAPKNLEKRLSNLYLNTVGSGGGAQQMNIPVKAGGKYKLKFSYHVLSGALRPMAGIGTSNSDFQGVYVNLGPSNNWKNYERTIEIPQNFIRDFRLVFTLRNGEAYIDNVVLEDLAVVIRTGTLTVATNPNASAPQVVAGQSTTTLGTWDFTAGNGEDIVLTNVSVDTDNTTAIGTTTKDCELWIDGTKRSSDTSSTITPTATPGGSLTFNISPSYTITKAQTATVELKCKILPTAIGGVTVMFRVAANGVNAYGATSATALSSTPPVAVAGQNAAVGGVTISSSGTLVVSRDVVTNIKASQIVAGTTNVTFGAYKLTTGNIEDVKIKKITVRNIGSNTNGVVGIGIYDGATLVGNVTKAAFGSDSSVLGNDSKSVTFDYSWDPYVIPKNSYKALTIKANTVYSATSGQTVQLVIDSIDAEGAGSAARIYPSYVSETASAASTNAWDVGTPVVASAGNGSRFASPVTTAVAVGATMDGASAMVAGFDLVNDAPATTYRLTKMKPVMFGQNIYGEAASSVSTYSYAIGDVVVLSDADVAANSDFQIITTAIGAGSTMLNEGTPLSGITLTASDRITRVAAGFSETALAMAETVYNAGDIVAYSSSTNSDLNGLQVVNGNVAVGNSLLPAIHAGYGTTNEVVAADRVTKMPTLHTELASAMAAYSYSVGDVIVISSATEYSNNGTYVVRKSVVVGSTILGDAFGTGVVLTTSDRVSKLYITSQEDNLKRLYPTKLNFAWVTPASTILATGSQVEIAKFTLGADEANVNNPDAYIDVTALNFTNLSSARLTNLTLKDYSLNSNVATTANSPSFSSSVAGGSMTAITLQQSETRTFVILANVCTYAGSQVAQLKFNAGNQFTTTGNSTATWTVDWASMLPGQSEQTSYWTVLNGDAIETFSTTLTAAASATGCPN